MNKAQVLYEQVLCDAVEAVCIAAVRHAIDTRLLIVEFDAGREPGPHQEHTLRISVRDFSTIAVTTAGIPHDWLSSGTGYIDMRFSTRVALLLHELDKKAQAAGHFI
jgi:hypothetical protein